MDETQIHHLSTSHIEPTLLGYLKMHIIFPMFSKSCALNQLNSEHIHGHSQNMWRLYFALMHIFPTNFFQNLSKCIHSLISLHHEIIGFLVIFLRKCHSQEINFSRNSEDFPKPVSQVKFFHSFPWKRLFSQDFQRSLSSFSKSKSISKSFKAKIPRISISQVSIFLLHKGFPMNFNHFPKKAFKTWSVSWQAFFPSNVSPFLKNSFHFLRIFTHSSSYTFLRFQKPLFFWVSWENWLSMRNTFQLQIFPKHASCFPTYIFQNLIAHAWILCALG